MPKKAYSKTGRTCRVTFSLMPEGQAQTVALCGEFNDWQPTAHLLQRRKDGNFSLTLSLTAGHQYRYRYLLDGERWENDPVADDYVANPFGTQDSLIKV